MGESCLQQSDKPSFCFFLCLWSLWGKFFLCAFGFLWCLSLSVFVYLTEMNAMGETTSLLDLPLTHYLDVNARAHSFSSD